MTTTTIDPVAAKVAELKAEEKRAQRAERNAKEADLRAHAREPRGS